MQDADCYIAKDKATINAMIEKFGSGGARAFERKIAEVCTHIAEETTGKRAVRRSNTTGIFSMRRLSTVADPAHDNMRQLMNARREASGRMALLEANAVQLTGPPSLLEPPAPPSAAMRVMVDEPAASFSRC